MHGIAASLAALASIMSVGMAAACETVGTNAESPLELRKPVRGEGVYFAAGFGARYLPGLKETRLHGGVDWAAPSGAPVIAAGAGRVSSAAPSGDYGNTVVIDHCGSWQTLYAHLATFAVRVGDCVGVGAIIGAVGMTGVTVAPHLHFEVWHDGMAMDPMRVELRPRKAK